MENTYTVCEGLEKTIVHEGTMWSSIEQLGHVIL